MKINIDNVVVTDLSGSVLNIELGKRLGEVIYTKTTSLGWLEHAQAIYKGQDIELSEKEVDELSQIINHPGCTLVLCEKVALIGYLSSPAGKAGNIGIEIAESV